MTPMHKPDGSLFGFIFRAGDENVESLDDRGLYLKAEMQQWLRERLVEDPRLDRTNNYILLIPRNADDLFLLKMAWC